MELLVDGEARASSSLSPRSGSRSGAGERVLQWNTAVPKRLKIASSKSFKVGSASALSTPGGVGTLVDEDSRPSPRAVSGPFGSVRDVRARTGLAEEDLDSSECSLSSGSCCCDFEMKEPHGTSVATVGRNSAFGVAESARIYEDQDAQLRDLDDRMKATELHSELWRSNWQLRRNCHQRIRSTKGVARGHLESRREAHDLLLRCLRGELVLVQ